MPFAQNSLLYFILEILIFLRSYFLRVILFELWQYYLILKFDHAEKALRELIIKQLVERVS